MKYIVVDLEEEGIPRSRRVPLVVNKEKGKKKTSLDSDQVAYKVRKVNRAFKNLNFDKFCVKKMLGEKKNGKNKKRSFNCQEEVHVTN